MALNQTQLKFFAKYIEDNTGIVYGDSNIYQLQIRIDNIAKSLGLPQTDDLWNKVQNGIPDQIKQVLLDSATNNETLFFRDRKVFNAIENLCIPEIKKLRPQAPKYRLWSAACSSGQEPYSVAMLCSENKAKDPLFNFEILATDFSDRILNYAKAGVYSQLEIQRGLPTNYLLKYFQKQGEASWKVLESLTKTIKFAQANLLDPYPASWGPFDIIFCRNVLIYQNTENKKKVIEKLAEKLQPKGFLILGGAESMLGLSEQFNQVSFEGSVIYQKKT